MTSDEITRAPRSSFGSTFARESKNFFNGTRLAGTARIGYGHVSLFGQYSITSFIKDGRGPAIHPYSIGITLSGL